MLAANLPSPGEAGVPLSDTSLRYVASLCRPDLAEEDAWVPYQTRSSEFNRCFSRGSFSTGTTGFGFVTINTTVVSDTSPGSASTAASVMTAATTISAATAPVALPNLNSRYTTAEVTSGSSPVQVQLVGLLLKVKYAGTELNRGGDMLLFETPNHEATGGYSYNTAMGADNCRRVGVSNDWQYVAWSPINEATELNWLAAATATGVNNTLLAIFVNSAGASQPFDFEVWEVFRAVGVICRGRVETFVDPIGAPVIFAAARGIMQLDSTFGIGGFMRSIHAQFQNVSCVKCTGAPRGNFLGLAPFLPALLSGAAAIGKFALPALKKAGTWALGGLASGAHKELGNMAMQKAMLFREPNACQPGMRPKKKQHKK